MGTAARAIAVATKTIGRERAVLEARGVNHACPRLVGDTDHACPRLADVANHACPQLVSDTNHACPQFDSRENFAVSCLSRFNLGYATRSQPCAHTLLDGFAAFIAEHPDAAVGAA